MHQGVYKELKNVARTEEVITYTVIGNRLGLNMDNPADRNEIAKVLDEINHYEHQYGRPMLSAVVIRGDINMPGKGFFECARDLGHAWKGNDITFWLHEIAKVHNYWKSQ